MNTIAIANVGVVSENLWHRHLAARTLYHLLTRTRHGGDIYLLKVDALGVQQLLGTKTVTAKRCCIYFDIRHC